jgi:hypothetical protein
MALVLRSAAGHLRRLGAEPLIVPAMGSHGGGTAEGQRRVIESYGITEEYCGCPIRATMETVVVCETEEGFPVHFDRVAMEADHVLVCNRVKPHTRFAGPIESGLMKMMLIGLGKHEGAKIYHRAITKYSFDQIVRSVASRVIERCGVVAGLALVENAYDETAIVRAMRADQIQEREPELLAEAKRMLPRLPFDEVDVLIVDEIGKNISGTGMDTNVVGRKFSDHAPTGDESPRVARIIVRSITERSYGNGTGIGIAEFCTAAAARQVDRHATSVNCITGSHPTAAMIPIHFETDREVLAAALATIGLVPPADAKLLWIHNTLDLAEVECSAAYLAQAAARDDLTILTEPRDMPLDAAGHLPPWDSAMQAALA